MGHPHGWPGDGYSASAMTGVFDSRAPIFTILWVFHRPGGMSVTRAIAASFAEFFCPRVKQSLDELCCSSLQFMWDNSLLSPREGMETENDAEGAVWYGRTLKGFRVVCDFAFMKRDQILYRCPFCDAELVISLGHAHGERSISISPTKIGAGPRQMAFPRDLLETWLREARAPYGSGWPPKD
jgi:hypothetical protein